MKMNFYTTLITHALFLLCVSGCRTDKPPQLSVICTLDGFGGGDCVLADGTQVYKSPSEMKDFWATSQVDEANFASWCYKVPVPVANKVMAQVKRRIMDGRHKFYEPRGANEE